MKYKILGIDYELTEGLMNYAKIKSYYEERASVVVENYLIEFDEKFSSMDEVEADFDNYFALCIKCELEGIHDYLIKNKIFDYDLESIGQIMNEETNIIQSFYDFQDSFMEEYYKIIYDADSAKEYRKARKNARSRFIGGGFGVGGAVKGMATAGALNLAGGLVHSAFNVIGNIGTSIAASMKKSKLFKKYRENLKAQYEIVFQNLYILVVILCKKNNIMEIEEIPKEDIDREGRIVNNIIEGKVDMEDIPHLIHECLVLNPLDMLMYGYLIIQYGDKDFEIQKLAEALSIPISKIKVKIIDDKINEEFLQILDDNLDEDFEEYEKYDEDKFVDSIAFEKELSGLIDKISIEKKNLGLVQNTVIEEKIKNQLEELDVVNRRVFGIEYDTRQEADWVREDYELLEEVFQNTSDSKLEDTILNIEFQSVAINKDELISDIKFLMNERKEKNKEYNAIMASAIRLMFNRPVNNCYENLTVGQREYAEKMSIYTFDPILNLQDVCVKNESGKVIFESEFVSNNDDLNKTIQKLLDIQHPLVYSYAANMYFEKEPADTLNVIKYADRALSFDVESAKEVLGWLDNYPENKVGAIKYFMSRNSHRIWNENSKKKKVNDSRLTKEVVSKLKNEKEVLDYIDYLIKKAESGLSSYVYKDIIEALYNKYDVYVINKVGKRTGEIEKIYEEYTPLLEFLKFNFDKVNACGINNYFDSFDERFYNLIQRSKEISLDEAEIPLAFFGWPHESVYNNIWVTNRRVLFSENITVKSVSINSIIYIKGKGSEINLYSHEGVFKFGWYTTDGDELFKKVANWTLQTVNIIKSYSPSRQDLNYGFLNDNIRNEIKHLCEQFLLDNPGFMKKNDETLEGALLVPRWESVYLAKDASLLKKGRNAFAITSIGLFFNKAFDYKTPIPTFIPFSKWKKDSYKLVSFCIGEQGTLIGDRLNKLCLDILNLIHPLENSNQEIEKNSDKIDDSEWYPVATDRVVNEFQKRLEEAKNGNVSYINETIKDKILRITDKYKGKTFEEILNQACKEFKEVVPAKECYYNEKLFHHFGISATEQILIGHDSTILSSGKEGFAITDTHVYSRVKKKVNKITYEEIKGKYDIQWKFDNLMIGNKILAHVLYGKSVYKEHLRNLFLEIAIAMNTLCIGDEKSLNHDEVIQSNKVSDSETAVYGDNGKREYKICSNCGQKIDVLDNFCFQCGTKVGY